MRTIKLFELQRLARAGEAEVTSMGVIFQMEGKVYTVKSTHFEDPKFENVVFLCDEITQNK